MGGGKVEKVTVRKSELLQALQANRDNHRGEFLKAQEGWKAVIMEELERRLSDARDGKRIQSSFSFPEPQDRTRDYERVIKMVEMEIAETITIPEADFSRYVMDDWEWKANWTASNIGYVNR